MNQNSDDSNAMDAADPAPALSLRERTFWRNAWVDREPYSAIDGLGMRRTGAATTATAFHALSPGTAASVLRVCKGNPELVLSATVASLAWVLTRFTRERQVALRVMSQFHAHGKAPNGLPLYLQVGQTDCGKDLLVRVKDALANFAARRPEAASPMLAMLEQQTLLSDVCCDLVTVERAAVPMPDPSTLVLRFCSQGSLPSISLDYPAGCHNELVASQLLRAHDRALGAILTNPTARLDALQFTDMLDLALLRPRPGDSESLTRDFDSVFMELCDRHAERPAVSDATCTLTYGALKSLALQFADGMRSSGMAGGGVACLQMQRSADMIVAMLGALCAGIAYSPIDPAYPSETLRETIRHTSARWVIGDTADIALGDGCQYFSFDNIMRAARSDGRAAPKTGGATADRLAYVILTSGSTGGRKATAVSVSNLLYSTQARVRFYEQFPGRWLLLSSISFDSSVAVIFGALLSGDELLLPVSGIERDPNRIAELVASRGITNALMLPSLLRLLLDAASPERLQSIRLAIVAGEAVDSDLVGLVHQRLPSVQLYNEYGPTEATVWSTVEDLTAADRVPSAPVCIGPPIDGTRAYVLDECQHPLPPGIRGELYVASPGVTWGYLNDGKATAERFLPDPFVDAGQRMYRTGDLVTLQVDGRLQFHGRVDSQLKIRGHRIEPAEVEALVRSAMSIRDVAVTSVHDASGDRMVAVLAGTAIDVDGLRARLLACAPAHLVPDVFVRVEQVPRLPNGKLNRRLLEQVVRADESSMAPPEDPLERKVHDIWCSVLGRRSLPVDANFFAIGGNSIAAAKVINQVQRLIDDYLYVVALFEQPTIRGLSDYLRREYSTRVHQLLGDDAAVPGSAKALATRLTNEDRERFDARLEANSHIEAASDTMASDAEVVFVLAPPRSGTTLLRVMLAGQPQLFSPPELELCSFDDMGSRARAFEGHRRFFLEGVVRALMELFGCDKEVAEHRVDEFVRRSAPVSELYRLLLDRLGGRILVDKTASYALSLQTLERCRRLFPRARYLHLTRHPCGMIRSFESARLDLSFLPDKHDWTPYQLGELVWQRAHDNVLRFRESLDPSRVLEVSFEDLTSDPKAQASRIARFIGVPFDEGMLDPYGAGRMTDGISADSRMLGDIKFHEHQGIDPSVARSWIGSMQDDELHPRTMEIARRFGYLPRYETGTFPLSFQQLQVFMADQFGAAGTYDIPWVLHFKGRIDAAQLQRALEAIVHRHAALRSRIVLENGEPRQHVDPPAPLSLDVVDLSGLPAHEARARCDELLNGCVQIGRYNLEKGPLWSAALIKLSQSEAYFRFNVHHIACDAWSLAVLTQDLVQLLRDPGRLAPPAAPYTHYALDQQSQLDEQALLGLEAEWDRLLGPDVRPSAFGSDATDATCDMSAGTHVVRVGTELSQTVRDLAARLQCPLSVVFQAALQALLHQETGRSEVYLGSAVACRTDPRFTETVGNFVNLIVTRGKVDPQESFGSLALQARSFMTRAIGIQRYPYERLVERLARREGGLIQTLFNFQSITHGSFTLDGLSAEMDLRPSRQAKFPLTLLVLDKPDLECCFEFALGRYRLADVARIAANYVELLRSAAKAADAPLLAYLRATDEAQQRLSAH